MAEIKPSFTKFYFSSMINVSSLTKNSITSSSTFLESESNSSVSIPEKESNDVKKK